MCLLTLTLNFAIKALPGTDLFAFLAEMDALADQAVGLEFRDGPE